MKHGRETKGLKSKQHATILFILIPQFPLKSMKEREYLTSVNSMKTVNILFSSFIPIKGLLRSYAFQDTDNK